VFVAQNGTDEAENVFVVGLHDFAERGFVTSLRTSQEFRIQIW
jgi:hypothetical protein